GLFEGKPDSEAGLPRLGLHFDEAVVPSYDTANGIESQARAFTDLLRCEKRVEDARLDVLRNSGPVVFNFNHGIVQFLARFDLQLALALHRIDGVVDQVGPNLIQLSTVCADAGQRSFVVSRDNNAIFHAVRKNLERIVQVLAQIHFLQGSLVHVRVALYRGDQFADSLRAVGDLTDQPEHIHDGCHAVQSVRKKFRPDLARKLLQLRDVNT